MPAFTNLSKHVAPSALSLELESVERRPFRITWRSLTRATATASIWLTSARAEIREAQAKDDELSRENEAFRRRGQLMEARWSRLDRGNFRKALA